MGVVIKLKLALLMINYNILCGKRLIKAISNVLTLNFKYF